MAVSARPPADSTGIAIPAPNDVPDRDIRPPRWTSPGPNGGSRAAAAVVLAGCLLTGLLIVLTRAGGPAAAWAALPGVAGSGAALVATALAWRAATSPDRRILRWVFVAAAVWAVAGLVALVPAPALGRGPGPVGLGPVGLVLLLTVVPGVGWLVASVYPELGPTPRAAGLIDIAAVIVAVGGTVVVALGATVERIDGPAAALGLTNSIVFFTGAAAVGIVAFQAAGRRSIPIATLAMAAGLGFFGLAEATDLSGGGQAAGTAGILRAIGPLAIAAGSVFGRPSIVRLRPDQARSTSSLLPVATALVAAIVIVVLDDRLDGIAEIGMRVAISITIVLVVARQTMLLADRGSAADRERAATRRAEAASVEADRIAQRLAVAEARFRHLVEQVPAAVYLDRIDVEALAISATVYVSPRIEALTGFTPDEIAADNDLWMSRVHDDDHAAVVVAWDRHCSERSPFSVTYRFLTKDGRTIWLAEDAAVLESDAGVYSQGTILDVTDRRESEALLRQAQKMEAVGQLAGGVAHDFNNLLTVITGHAGLLRETVAADDPSLVDVEAIATAAESSADLVGQLLAFGRRTMLRPEVVDIGAVVGNVLPMLRRLLPENIEVVTRLAADVPAIRADPGQIQQVVLNLAINGRDAMPSGGTLTIETEARTVAAVEADRHPGLRAGAYVLLVITDDGTGMDAATRDRVFEPFFTTKSAGRGTGLGLATVYGIVKQSGGYISIDSVVDGGSTFRVFLPTTSDDVAVPLAEPPPHAPRGQERIVLCEDEPAVRELVAAVLRRSGYAVVAAASPAEALVLIGDRPSPVDLLLTDVVMPGMSGPDLARRAAAMRPDLRIILMSGYALDAADRDAVGRQAVFLAKPFDPATLARTVRNVLDGVVGDGQPASLDEVAVPG